MMVCISYIHNHLNVHCVLFHSSLLLQSWWMPFESSFGVLIGLKTVKTSEDIRRWRIFYRFLWSQLSSCNCRCIHFSCTNGK
jgi:hypothetical protein